MVEQKYECADCAREFFSEKDGGDEKKNIRCPDCNSKAVRKVRSNDGDKES